MPKVSIIVPVYKVEKYLEECVESLLHQSMQDIEIILIDDGSPDHCPILCDNYCREDPRVKVVHKNNGGLGFARNTGLEIATGEYVAFTDSDDREAPETYETLYSIAVRDNVDVVYYRFIDSSKTEKISCYYEGIENVRKLMLEMVGNLPSGQKERNIQVSSCLGLYRRELLVNNNLRFHSERELISEDLIFNIDVLNCALKVVFTDNQFYYYRTNNSSLSHTVRADRHEMNKKFYSYLNEKLDSLGFGYEGWLRATRLFIGYSRSTMFQLCRSNLSWTNKRVAMLSISNDEIWKDIRNRYPYKQLPWKYRLTFDLMCKKALYPLWLISKIS